MSSLISIIIPTYNRANLIGETLDSILAQTHQKWECIIIDDGSSDNTDEIISQYLIRDNRFQYFKRPENNLKGPGFCRNYGFQKSVGDFIYWFDSDDILMSDALERRLNCFQTDVDVVIGRAEFFDTDSKEILFRNKIVSQDLIYDYFIGAVTFYVSGPMWRKKFLIDHHLLFDEKISYLDDWDFNLRAIYKLPNIIVLDEVMFLYRSHAYSLSKQVNFLNIEELISECYARNKHYALLKKNGLSDDRILEFLLKRFRIIFKEILIKSKKRSFYFYFNLIQLQLKNKKIRNAVKTTFGFVLYKTFKRGFVLIK